MKARLILSGIILLVSNSLYAMDSRCLLDTAESGDRAVVSSLSLNPSTRERVEIRERFSSDSSWRTEYEEGVPCTRKCCASITAVVIVFGVGFWAIEKYYN